VEQEVEQEGGDRGRGNRTDPGTHPDPEEAKAMASTASNATKDAPQITDPSTWNESGKKIMEALETQVCPLRHDLAGQRRQALLCWQ